MSSTTRNIILVKCLLFVFFLGFWLYGASDALKSSREAYQPLGDVVSKDIIPGWMPQPWVDPLLKELSLRKYNFNDSIPDMMHELEKSIWVESVSRVYRDFSGEVKMNLKIHRPVCIFKNREVKTFGSAKGHFLRMFSDEDTYTLDEQGRPSELPIIDVKGITSADVDSKNAWVRELTSFVNEWNAVESIHQRLQLKLLEPEIYSARDGLHLMLKCQAFDRKLGGDVSLQWGELIEFSIVEDKSSEEKWKDLQVILQNDKPFSSLDLRYKESGVFLLDRRAR